MAKKVIIHKNDIKEGWSLEAADCINRMLQRKPAKRLGVNGTHEVKKHIWFKNYPWSDLYNNKLISPFIPPIEDNFDYKYCNNVEKQGLKTKERYAEIIISDNYKSLFNNYFYFNRYDMKYQENASLYPNIHEKMYKIMNPHNRNRSVVTDFSNYRRFSNNKKINVNDSNNPLLVNHGRAFSAMGVIPNKAFLEANNYINNRKFIKKKAILDNYKLEANKSKKNIFVNDKGSNKNKTSINKIKIFMVNNNTGNTGNQGSTNGNTDTSSKDKENYNSSNTVKNCLTKIKK